MSRARRSRKLQSSSSEAQRFYEGPSRQLKNKGEKFFFRALHSFDRHYTPLCTAFSSGRTTPKDFMPPLDSANVLCNLELAHSFWNLRMLSTISRLRKFLDCAEHIHACTRMHITHVQKNTHMHAHTHALEIYKLRIQLC